jgi:hypothetical protein
MPIKSLVTALKENPQLSRRFPCILHLLIETSEATKNPRSKSRVVKTVYIEEFFWDKIKKLKPLTTRARSN